MADLYGTSGRSPPSLESEGMFPFLNNILHNSLTSPSSSLHPPFKDNLKQSFSSLPPPRPAAAEATSSSTANLDFRSPMILASDSRFRERASTGGWSVMPDSSAGLYFSDHRCCFMADAKECTKNASSATCAVDSEGITSKIKRKFPSENVVDDFGSDCKKGPEASEAPANPAPPRSSRKSRAAEVHNLSEKRRRIRINEKMKELQKLIPNSNKTDKASMLDEAIEYLKQLQRQVQMLSMRNGFGLHQYLPESLHPTQLPQEGMGYDEGNVLNTNRREDTFSPNQESSMLAALDLPSGTPSNQPNIISLRTSIPNSETSFGLEPSIHNHYGLFDHLTSSKVTLP